MKTVQDTWPLALPSGGLLVLALGALLASAPGALLAPHHLRAQVTYDRILRSADEPQNWLTYNGNYSSQRHSGLEQITRDNVDDLDTSRVSQLAQLEDMGLEGVGVTARGD